MKRARIRQKYNSALEFWTPLISFFSLLQITSLNKLSTSQLFNYSTTNMFHKVTQTDNRSKSIIHSKCKSIDSIREHDYKHVSHHKIGVSGSIIISIFRSSPRTFLIHTYIRYKLQVLMLKKKDRISITTTILVDQLTIIANPKLIRWINTTSVDGQLRGTKVHIKAI